MIYQIHWEFFPYIYELWRAGNDEGLFLSIPRHGAFRTNETQRKLRRELGTVAAQPGRSFHEYGFAIDINTSEDGYRFLGKIASELGIRWGKFFNEPWHFDVGYWVSVEEVKKDFRKKDLIKFKIQEV